MYTKVQNEKEFNEYVFKKIYHLTLCFQRALHLNIMLLQDSTSICLCFRNLI